MGLAGGIDDDHPKTAHPLDATGRIDRTPISVHARTRLEEERLLLERTSETSTVPVVVLRKYNKYSFLALPLTTRASRSPYKLPIGNVGGKQAFAVVSQLRNIDTRRLYQKIAWLPPDTLSACPDRARRPAPKRLS